MGDGTLRLTGQVRVRRSSFDLTIPKLSDRVVAGFRPRQLSNIVQVIWAERAGKNDLSYADVPSTNDGFCPQ